VARTDNDTWDPAASVGATATAVAVGRALASRGPHALIDDPYAAPLVRAAGVEFFIQLVDGSLDAREVDGDALFGITGITDMMAVRTRFFDDFFLDAAHGGISQMVILAAGLDARAYRLPWPSGTTVFEIDQPRVVEFKTRVMHELGAAPTADCHAVAVDLRDDWALALQRTGFDAGRPTAWIAEGLLAFLPPVAQDRLLDTITDVSVPGSRLAVDNMGGSDGARVMQDLMHQAVEHWRQHGFDIDMTDLSYVGERNDVADYLGACGWTTRLTRMSELFSVNGLSLGSADYVEGQAFSSFGYVTATRR
jgi:methyltransferase (TIGR00027 family)